nr:restriction endonuclease subunit S [Streptomyces sp. 8K308]
MSEARLPTGWSSVRLGDLGDWYGGSTPSKSHAEFWTSGSIPWISPKDMGEEVISTTQKRITKAAIEKTAVRLVPAGSVAIVMRSGILERKVPVAFIPFAATLNQDIKAVHPHEGILPLWVAWALRAYEGPILRKCRKAGTTVASLSTAALMDLQIPIAPLAEQHRIIETLGYHLSHLETAGTLLRRSMSRSGKVRQTAISRALRGEGIPLDLSEGTAEDFRPRAHLARQDTPWSIPRGWIWTTVGDLFTVNVGTTPSRTNSSLWAGAIPWVSSGEVSFGRISGTREHISEEAISNKKARLHPPGTVMIAMIGEGKTRGQAAILDIEAAHNQNCASIRVSETRVLPEYIYLVLEQRYLETRRASSGGNQPALNKAKVASIPVPLAPLATQRRIVSTIYQLGDRIARLTHQLDAALKKANHLRLSLLLHAFSGELVPSDASEEAPHSTANRSSHEGPSWQQMRGVTCSTEQTRGSRDAPSTDTLPPPARFVPAPNAVQEELPL